MRFVFSVVVLLGFSNSCLASLAINLKEVAGDQVEVSWSGFGTIAGTDTSHQLSFDNFGTPFKSGISGGVGSNFTLSGLQLSGSDDSNSSASYTNSYTDIRLYNNTNFDNVRLLGGGGSNLVLGAMDTYSTEAGTFLVTGLNFSDLNVGTYVTTGTDASLFGSVTLNITAVPEPSAFLFGGLVCGLLGLKSIRKRKSTAQN